MGAAIFFETLFQMNVAVDTGRKLNVHTSWASSELLMYAQFTSCVYWVAVSKKNV